MIFSTWNEVVTIVNISSAENQNNWSFSMNIYIRLFDCQPNTHCNFISVCDIKICNVEKFIALFDTQ